MFTTVPVSCVRGGSQFQLDFQPLGGGGVHVESLVNGSLLFHSTQRTAFLLGGWPQGAEVSSQPCQLMCALYVKVYLKGSV